MGHVPSLCVLCSPYKPLRPLLFAFVPLLISFPTKGPLAYVACDRKVSWFCLLCNLVLQMALHSFLDVVATLYHSFSSVPIVFRSLIYAYMHSRKILFP